MFTSAPTLLKHRFLIVLLTLCGSISSTFGQQTLATFTGKVTDDNTGQGIANVAVVAQGNENGTRVVLSDSEGNYNLSVGSNTNIRLRAYKPGFFFNPALAGFASIGGLPVTGKFPLNFSGTSLPFPILILLQAPILLTEDNSLNALAVDSLFHTRDPFPLTNEAYFASDKRTRIKLFLVDLDLFPSSGETLSIINVQGRDALQINHTFPVEDMRKAPGFPWITQLTLLMPSDLTGPAELTITVSARGLGSNPAKIHIK